MKSSLLKSTHASAKGRRRVALASLEKQLEAGTKPNRGTTAQKLETPFLPLSTKDITRITKEIEVLKTRI